MAQVVDSGTFSIRLFGAIDVTLPSTPVLVSATPIANTQIDVVWGASTDDYYLSGYVLSRDGTPIATTTLTNFSDSGLIASTTYSYSVVAFDSAYNYSAVSNVIATTTSNAVPPVVVASSTNPSSGTAVRTVLERFSLVPARTSASIDLTTVRPSRIEVRWGRTGSYELGYVVNQIFSKDFRSVISDLEPGTRYEYEVVGYSPIGIATVLKRGQFITLSEAGVAPSNVSLFNATIENKDVRLNWRLPKGDVQNVRIVRSNLGYPLTPNDGAIVYQGKGESFTDVNILEVFSPVYYSAFVYDSLGNVSSGAVLRVALDQQGGGLILPPNAIEETPVRSEEGVDIFVQEATTTDPEIDQVAVRIPQVSEIRIITRDSLQTFKDEQLTIAKNDQYTISIPAYAVSKNLKTIILSFTDPNDAGQSYSYILRLNKDGSAYEAVIEPLYASGASNFTVAVYDYEARIVSRYFKRVFFGDIKRGQTDVWFPDYLFKHPEFLYGATGGLILLMMLGFFVWRRVEDKLP